MLRITDKTFHYTNAANSAKPGYLRRKFDRIRREQKEREAKQKAADEAISVEQAVKVHVLKGATK